MFYDKKFCTNIIGKSVFLRILKTVSTKTDKQPAKLKIGFSNFKFSFLSYWHALLNYLLFGITNLNK